MAATHVFDSETLADRGFAVARGLIGADQCRALAALWPEKTLFRKHIVMQRHGYGQGEYQYFAYDLPEPVQRLRQALYPALAEVADRWNEQLGRPRRFPATLDAWLRECHEVGQKRPTPLLLRYGLGDYNCLHRDLYGEMVFPLQVVVLLSAPGRDFTGGEFMLVEQRPRMQSRGEVVPLEQGDAAIFAVNERPAKGVRGWHRTALRHGVSSLRSGERFTLGLIFHDAA
ncbi:MAG: proline hydroxylase [Reyranella sp.]|uniref:2OG-Fe(II) oxygenase n=1 Tax=Reyranella sp. TaxID=1929291 RepID=UPI001205DACD|nr:2OG-Fe(II) oxygenase [Reyranella sp.]TAJ86361.1 MAG: proline hydroxylase [Reyranella sp.]TBR28475.1 MAG: proline hydroxylase [Reyranella sp.]